MLDRILLILKTKNISASQFADEIGVQRSSISHLLSERNKPSLDFIKKVLNRYPNIQTEWLLFGKGAMYNANGKAKEENIIENEEIVIPKKETTTEQITSEPIPMEKQLKEHTPENKDTRPKQTQQPLFDGLTSNKHIEKIVVFYHDKTFKVYYTHD